MVTAGKSIYALAVKDSHPDANGWSYPVDNSNERDRLYVVSKEEGAIEKLKQAIPRKNWEGLECRLDRISHIKHMLEIFENANVELHPLS